MKPAREKNSGSSVSVNRRFKPRPEASGTNFGKFQRGNMQRATTNNIVGITADYIFPYVFKKLAAGAMKHDICVCIGSDEIFNRRDIKESGLAECKFRSKNRAIRGHVN